MPKQKQGVIVCGRTESESSISSIYYLKTPKTQASEVEVLEILAQIKDDLESPCKRKTVRNGLGYWAFIRDERGVRFALFTRDYPLQLADHFLAQVHQYYQEFWVDGNEKRLKLSINMLMKKYADIKKVYKQMNQSQKQNYLNKEINKMMSSIGESGSTLNDSQSLDIKHLEEKFNRITKPRPPNGSKKRVAKIMLAVLIVGLLVVLALKFTLHF